LKISFCARSAFLRALCVLLQIAELFHYNSSTFVQFHHPYANQYTPRRNKNEEQKVKHLFPSTSSKL
jgi:hypothetical protein